MTDLFELDKAKVKASFSSASTCYDKFAALQRRAADTLLQHYVNAPVSGQVLDIGCGTGYLTSEIIRQHAIETMTALDIAHAMLQVARCFVGSDKPVLYVCADAESLPIAAQSMDWVFSNLALQWCRDLEAVFSGIKHGLKTEGQLLFTTFGPQTLKELKQAWAEVDQLPHVNEFYQQAQLLTFLQQAGFVNIRCTSRVYLTEYNHVFELMRELKGIGAHNVAQGRSRVMTGKNKFNAMLAAYQTLSVNGLFPASYEIIYVTAQRGD